jgi:peptidylprolyl isomerase
MVREQNICRNRKKCDYDAGRPCNLLKSQWRMLSVFIFYEFINIWTSHFISEQQEVGMTQAKQGDTVKIHYTGTLTDGTVFDSSAGREPLSFTIGSGQVIPGFEEAVMGMTRDEEKNITIPVDKAYGPHNAELVFNVPRSQVPPEINPETGQRLQMQGPHNQPIIVTVTEVTDEYILLDANPPLAGKELNFAIQLVAIS